MGFRINNNIAAVNSYRNLSVNDKALGSSLEKLSSGFRINKAADDAAGLVISEGLRSQIGGLTVAARSAQDGVNVAQTADGALGTSTSILQRMRDLALQAKNDTNNVESRQAIKDELDSLSTELTRISDRTSFNGVKLLDGDFTGKVFQVGYESDDAITADFKIDIAATPAVAEVVTSATIADYTAVDSVVFDGQTVTTTSATDQASLISALTANTTLNLNWTIEADGTDKIKFTAKTAGDLTDKTLGGNLSGTTTTQGADEIPASTAGFDATDLGVNALTVNNAANAALAVDAIEAALDKVSSARASIGALQNRFEHVINSVNVSIENLTASESAIRDTDMAAEMTKFTRSQILSQAGTSMLAQANSASQNILSLLRG